MVKKKDNKEKKSTFPYRTVSLPNDFYNIIDEHVKLHPDYVSIANFVRIACREKMEMAIGVIYPKTGQESILPPDMTKSDFFKELDKRYEKKKK